MERGEERVWERGVGRGSGNGARRTGERLRFKNERASAKCSVVSWAVIYYCNCSVRWHFGYFAEILVLRSLDILNVTQFIGRDLGGTISMFFSVALCGFFSENFLLLSFVF